MMHRTRDLTASALSREISEIIFLLAAAIVQGRFALQGIACHGQRQDAAKRVMESQSRGCPVVFARGASTGKGRSISP
jgi:hypothetical protein